MTPKLLGLDYYNMERIEINRVCARRPGRVPFTWCGLFIHKGMEVRSYHQIVKGPAVAMWVRPVNCPKCLACEEVKAALVECALRGGGPA